MRWPWRRRGGEGATEKPGWRRETWTSGDRLSEREVAEMARGRCPRCGVGGELREGPCGGMSMNVYCAGCGLGVNVMPLFGVDVIATGGLPLPSFVGTRRFDPRELEL